MIEQIKSHLTEKDVFSDSEFELSLLRRSPQIPFPEHTHDFTELVIVYDGSGIHFTEKEEYSVGSGDVYILTGDRAHGYRELKNLKLINILFNRRILQKMPFPGFDLESINGYNALFTWEPRLRRKHRFESRLRLNSDELLKALQLSDRIEKELTACNPGYKAVAYALFIELCGFLSRCYDASTSGKLKELSRISKILSYMENHISEVVPASKLLSLAGMSESTLLRLFHNITGMSPVEYHNRLKIERVCSELQQTDKTITEIAFDLGFSDSNYLTRLFKKTMGIPPGEWRKHIGRVK